MPFALYFLALAVFVMGTSEFMLAGLLPAIATDLNVDVAAAGLLTSAFAISMAFGAPLMAALSRRLPERTTLLSCLLLFAISHATAALAPDYVLLLITRILGAVSNAGFLAVALNTATRLAPAHLKGRALAILLAGTSAATIAGVPAGTLLGAHVGWRSVFWVIGSLCLPAIVAVFMAVPVSRAAGAPADRAPQLITELAELFTPRLAGTMLLAALVNGGTFAVFTFIAPLVTTTAGLAEPWVPLVLVLFGLGSFAGITVAGRVSDRRPVAVLATGGPLLLAGWIALALLAERPAALLALVFAQGFLSFALGSTLIGQVIHAATGAPTMGGSYATMALNAGAALGPVLGGITLSAGFGLLAPVWVAALLVALAMLISLVAPQLLGPRPRR
ncbi:MFS transporter [Glutamicibacter halophytocola]|uniref:MFS transporter n=1 Tax=Glutamicibacter halophytocola TaxID=1933880 RepID=A0ABX5Y480_9MICC|nr:Cmx/CmrA family chloramphenicol efflux MFS transporter [Glutamicibacter halophytocola]NQD41885.1 MFS transporter [Glutamicibacter halophytocola]QDY64918.1 MFS transporter [Glutamicibacter halophytocola]